jgi:hypothetical protein
MLKQQVQETTGFLKKQQQSFADKVQKGFKMTPNFKFGQQKNKQVKKEDKEGFMTYSLNPADVKDEIVFDDAGVVVDPAWLARLEQMGFKSSQVFDAAAMLGGQPEQMEDLLQVLVAMTASDEADVENLFFFKVETMQQDGREQEASAAMHEEESSTSLPPPPLPAPLSPPSPPMRMPSMSACGSIEFEMAMNQPQASAAAAATEYVSSASASAIIADTVWDVESRVCGKDPSTAASTQVIEQIPPVEMPARELAAVLVAAAIDKCTKAIRSPCEIPAQKKHPIDPAMSASPVRGGA